MALILTDEEQALADSVRKFVADRSPLSSLRHLISSGEPYDADVWKQMTAQLGLAGLTIPEEYGGVGAGMSALSVAETELGAGLVASPLLTFLNIPPDWQVGANGIILIAVLAARAQIGRKAKTA